MHAIHMGEDVLSVFEHAIKALSYKDDLMDSRYVVSEYPLFPFCSSSGSCLGVRS
ncbi:hypothetical protein ZEAMMB73_Zm00001d035667 [Zea mays]|uniref:Uncharacterized protein n=1 Tax=Zea mays TaxID=4577 RepID=A0A1D6LHR9_MAIZE|nr:hypothetical protein ZEAMMB73_Zm00001d035667 [Zea mays]